MIWTAADMPDQAGRVAVVTGATSGLGRASAVALAEAGAHVVLAVRDPARGERTRSEIAEELAGGRSAPSLAVARLDLASLASVQECAERLLADYPRLDLLLNNAGIMASPAGLTVDGLELQLGTNHFGHFALTARLWPALRDTAGARVVTVTSTARHFGAHVDPGDLPMRRYDPWRAYGRSKFANAVFGLELHRRILDRGRAAASLVAHPGYSNTNLQHTAAVTQGGQAAQFFARTVTRVGISAADGALSQLRAAVDPEAVSGQLYAPRWINSGPPVHKHIESRARNPTAGVALWSISEEATGVRFEV